MKYPAIVKGAGGDKFLCANEYDYYDFPVEYWSKTDEVDEFYDCKNITTEYLANTYGEVKSKEHAEFIVKLAEVNGVLVEGRKPNKANWFSFRYISGNLTLTLLSYKTSLVIDSSRKQITIPLPPESKDDDSLNENGDNLIFGDADKCKGQVPESYYNELLKRFDHMCDLHGQLSTITQLLMHDGVDVEKLLNIGTDGYNMPYSKDYMDWRKHTITALTNVINVGEGKCKEWPFIGDEVQTNFGKGVVELLPDVKGCFVVQVNGGYLQLKRDELEKPKTPEEDLRELLSLLWKENNHDFDMFLDVVTCHVTKKPQ